MCFYECHEQNVLYWTIYKFFQADGLFSPGKTFFPQQYQTSRHLKRFSVFFLKAFYRSLPVTSNFFDPSLPIVALSPTFEVMSVKLFTLIWYTD